MTATHDTRAHLLAAILAQPDEDTPRLVYADWLEEFGGDADRARAEFIRTWYDDGAKPRTQTWYNGAAGVANRADELLRRYGHLWLGSYYGVANGRNWVFRRGFVEVVRCDGDDWVRHADAILAEHPVREVRLTRWPDLPHTVMHDPRGSPVYVFHVAGEPVAVTMREVPPDSAEFMLVVLSRRWPAVTFHPPT